MVPEEERFSEEEINFMQMEKVFLNDLILQEISQYIDKSDFESLYETNTILCRAVQTRPEFTSTRKICIYRKISSYKNGQGIIDSDTDISVLQNSSFPYQRMRLQVNGNWNDAEWDIITRLSQNVKHIELVMAGPKLENIGKLVSWLNSMRRISSLQLEYQLLLMDNDKFLQLLGTKVFDKITNLELCTCISKEGLEKAKDRDIKNNFEHLSQKLNNLNRLKLDEIYNNEERTLNLSIFGITMHLRKFLTAISRINLQQLQLNCTQVLLQDLFGTIIIPSLQQLSITIPASKVNQSLLDLIQNQPSITSLNLEFIDGLIPNPFCPLLKSMLSNLPHDKLRKIYLAFQLQTGGREIEENHKNWWKFLSNYTNLELFEYIQLNFINEIRRYVFSIPCILSNFNGLQRKPIVKISTISGMSKGAIFKTSS